MRLNTANRSFFVLVATALVPYVLLGLFGCGVLALVGYRIAAHGLSGLDRGGQDLRPAAAFFALVALGTIVGGVSVGRQVRATRRLGQALAVRAMPAAPALEQAAARVHLDGQVDLVADDEPFSFTYGLFSPRIAVSSGLLDTTDAAELDAVLHHERYHVRNRDTLKVVVARAAPTAFFFLPALGYLRDRYLAGRELAADRHAVRACGERALTGALVKTLVGPAWVNMGAAAALGGSAFLEHRVEQLEDGREPALPRVPRAAFWATLAALGILVGVFALTVGVSGSADMSMRGSTRLSVVGTMVATLGSAGCMVGVGAAVVLLARRGRSHRAGA